MADHICHLRQVFLKLREIKFYVNKNKCELCSQEVKFFSHWVSKGQIQMDDKKVKAILDWPPPTKMTDLRSFLGLANYYRKFI